MTRYRYGVFIVRGQPITLAHLFVIMRGLMHCDEMIIVLGSAFTAPRWDFVPFREHHREAMIRLSLEPQFQKRVRFIYMMDYGNMPEWSDHVARAVTEITGDDTVALVGHRKDKPTGYYLSQFSMWDSIDVPNYNNLNATDTRDIFIQEDQSAVSAYLAGDGEHALHKGTIDYLNEFRKSSEYASLVDEKVFMKKYLAQWDSAPYKPVFYTADNVVMFGNMIPLIERKDYPCKGLLALPGGHCENQTAFEAALKELDEETRMKIPQEVLRGSVVGEKTYDDPYRSTRYRTVSHATFFNIVPKIPQGITDSDEIRKIMTPPKIRAASDAKRAKWYVASTIPRERLMEDHWKMIADAQKAVKK